MEESLSSSTAEGKPRPCPALRSLSRKFGGIFCRRNTTNRFKRLDSKLERKLVEIRQVSIGDRSFRSINSIILRFPQFKEQLQSIGALFQQYDEDRNGIIDHQELRKCLQKLQLNLTEPEIDDLFCSCDVNGIGGIKFNEFVVLLCLCHLLAKSSSPPSTSRMESPELEATFDTMIEAFMFMDKNADGKLNKKDMVKALDDVPLEKSPSHVSRSRFMKLPCDLYQRRWTRTRMEP